MAIQITFRPIRFQAPTRTELMRKIQNFDRFNQRFICNPLARRGFNFLESTPKRNEVPVYRFYNLEKRNKKTRTKLDSRGRPLNIREVIQETHWVAHVYDIPCDLVDMKRSFQATRYFRINVKP